jgi:hypothetical protein
MHTLFRRSITAAALLLVSLTFTACGGADAVAGPNYQAPTTGAVAFKVDGQSCVGSSAIDFYLDGSIIGTENLTAGGAASKSYVTSAGQHVVGAAVSNTRSFVWPSQNVMVTAGGVWTALLKCS